jgi:hypothetical protein
VNSERSSSGHSGNKVSPRRTGRRPAPAWLSIRVELVEGQGEHLWPRPGRLFAASTTHSFSQLATAIDDAFARWDRSHLHEFELADGTRVGMPDEDSDEEVLDETRETLSRLQTSQQFIYSFDFGDDWAHLCTVVGASIDPLETLGLIPKDPLPFFGWGSIPDQYGRRWAEDDSEAAIPADPELHDLPPLRPGWGPNP